MQFVKMNGLGNDFIVVDFIGKPVPEKNWPELAVRVCDRRFGVGGDGLMLLTREDGKYRMTLYNSDGSVAPMCGNGVRCVAKYLVDNGYCKPEPIDLLTDAGNKWLIPQMEDGKVVSVSVDLGVPDFTPANIPVDLPGDAIIDRPVEVLGQTLNITAVSMGNTHAVIFVPDVEAIDFEHLGPAMEKHEIFPRRSNIEFVQVIDRQNLRVRVWERGAGATMACGTGGAAVTAASVVNGLAERNTNVFLPGGKLQYEWKEDGHMWMTGPAKVSFTGEWEE